MKTHKMPGPSGPGAFSPRTFSITTLGCKSNQYDSATLAADLTGVGLTRFDPADAGDSHVVIINTCMVTGSSEAQCRKAIRQARRATPNAMLVVAGCMSKGSREDIEAMDEVDLIIEPSDKGKLPGLLGLGDEGGWTDWPEDPAVEVDDRDRGFLKVQDGCNAACTYCIVPSVRGRSRSLEPERVLNAIGKLMESGFGEVVLSGIHLGQYGTGLPRGNNLETLLDRYLELDLPGRLRLSSLEPLEITDSLISIVGNARGRICRHFHIPLQSGSDKVLAAMNRPYRRDQFSETVHKVRDSMPGVGIGCDVICGFPGETDEDFTATLDLVDGLGLPFIHAFPYSPRPGTPAADLRDDVPHQVKKERVAALTAAVSKHRVDFAKNLLGQSVEMALESRTDEKGRIVALADNYLRGAVVAGGHEPAGTLVDTSVTGVQGDVLIGQMLPDSRQAV